MTVTNTAIPVLSGTARVGQTVTTDNGSWTFDLDYLTYAYQWLRCDAVGANCVSIGGATSGSYVPVSTDIGHTLRSEVTATEHAAAGGGVANPPNGWGSPLVISAGGVYDGTISGIGWQSTSAGTPAVRVATNDPVTIRGWVKHVDGGYGIFCNTGPVQVTVDHVFAYGAAYPNFNSSDRWFNAEQYKSITIQNCTIENTRGIELDQGALSSTVLITRCKHTNIVGSGTSPVANFVQFRVVENSNIEVSWNEVINEYNNSYPEDLVSLYHTSNAWVHDNYFQGQFMPGNGPGSSQNGITLDGYGGSGQAVSNNTIENNQMVRTLSIGLFPTNTGPGNNNVFRNNRVVNAGYLDDGTTRNYYGYQGMAINAGGSNNQAHGNVLGTMKGTSQGSYSRGNDGDFTGETRGNGNGVNTGAWADNTHMSPAGGTITRTMEDAEFTSWQAKLAANGITVGA